MSVKQIVPGVYQVSIKIVNAFLLKSDDGLTVIDTGISGGEKDILAAIAELGYAPSDVKHILVTHYHGDHIGGLAALKEATGAPATMHPLDAALVEGGENTREVQPSPSLFSKLVVSVIMRNGPMGAPPVTVENRVEDGEELDIAGGLKAILLPGHSAGQVGFLWPQHGGVFFVGDVASNMFSLGWPILFEDFEAGKQSLAKMGSMDFEVACFGHGKSIIGGAAAQFRQKWGS